MSILAKLDTRAAGCVAFLQQRISKWLCGLCAPCLPIQTVLNALAKVANASDSLPSDFDGAPPMRQGALLSAMTHGSLPVFVISTRRELP